MSFAETSTPALLAARANLLRGLDLVAATIDAGTFDTIGPAGSAPPSQSGHLTLALLRGVDAELENRLAQYRRRPDAVKKTERKKAK